ncbi:MAG: hypothetical protein ACQESJ_05310 [Bacteroidota bacterium]
MKIRYIFVFCVLFFSKQVFSSGDNYPVGGRSAGLANASVMLPDYWSLFHNQAGLAFFNSPKVGIHHKRGVIKQLSHQAVGFALPTGNGTIGGSCSYFGFSKYHEVKSGLAYSMLLDENLAAGVQLDYFYTHIDGFYGNVHSVAAEIGIIYRPLENFYVGTHVFNPFQTAQLGNVEHMPVIFRFGTGYHVQEELLLTVESEMDLDKKTRFKAGMEYEIIDAFYIRTGISSNPVTNSFGVGYIWNELGLDVSFSRHIVLGYSPQFSLNFSF